MWQKIVQYKWFVVSFACSFILLFGEFFFAYVRLQNVGQPIITHFNDRGINQVGTLGDLAAVFGTGLVIVVMNAMITFALVKRDRMLASLVTASTLFASVLLFVALRAIIRIN